jgi:hypothetical protein
MVAAQRPKSDRRNRYLPNRYQGRGAADGGDLRQAAPSCSSNEGAELRRKSAARDVIKTEPAQFTQCGMQFTALHKTF